MHNRNTYSNINKDKKLFWKSIQIDFFKIYEHLEQLSDENDSSYEYYSNQPKVYENIYFPSFDNNGFKGYPILKDDKLHTIFEYKKIEFINCHFLEVADFSEYPFYKSVKFNNCHFHKSIVLNKSHYNDNLEFNNCDFYSRALDLNNIIFNSILFFKNCKNIGSLDLSNSIVSGNVSFTGTSFQEVNFEKTKFQKLAVFNHAIFEKNLDFKYTKFYDSVYFKNVTIQGKLNLDNTIFQDEVNFLNMKSENNKPIKEKNIANRETARIIKHSFEKIDNIIESNKFHRIELEKRKDEVCDDCESFVSYLECLVLYIHKISSNYSQNWFLALLWIFIIGLLTSYSINNDFNINNIFKYMSVLQTDEIKDCPIIFLLHKSALGYLYYQLVISIRQNTRRK